MDAQYAIDLIARYGYVTLFIIIAVENIEFFGSIPTSLIAATVGVASSRGMFDPYLAVFLLTFSSVVGDVIGFWIGRKFGRAVFERLASRMIRSGKIARAEKLFERFGVWGVFFSRFIFASFQAIINIVAGISKMRFVVFFPAALIGEFIWSVIYFIIGYFLWDSFSRFLGLVKHLGIFGGIISIVALVGIIWLILLIRRRARAKKTSL